MFDRTALFRRVQSLLARGDWLAMPTLTRTARPIDQIYRHHRHRRTSFDSVRPHWFPWTMLFNMTGHPAISMPCGFGRDGLAERPASGRAAPRARTAAFSALFEASSYLLGRWPA